MVRRSSETKLERIKVISDNINLLQGDLLDQGSMDEAIKKSEPDEVYNLGAQSFVPTSWNQPILTGEITALGVTRILEAIRKIKPDAKFYQASSSEMFGKVQGVPQTERTLFYPRSPYGCAKVYAYWMTINYRESYNMFACNGILFNHESPRRGEEFVTRKITKAVARIKLGLQKNVELGNLSAERDWSFAGDVVKAMYLMLQQKSPDDYVICSGETHSVREFCQLAFDHAGLNYQDHVITSKKFIRPAEVDQLIGDYSKAKEKLGWEPKTTFKQLITDMVDNDLKKQGAK